MCFLFCEGCKDQSASRLGIVASGAICVLCFGNIFFRKRFNFFSKLGKLSSWLEFHIFCGILGPIFIVFHSNFKVKGLVAISFWSMVIASTSGIFGRYFYIQTLKKKDELKRNIDFLKNEFMKRNHEKFSPEKFEEIFQHAFESAGSGQKSMNPLRVLYSSLKSDIYLMFNNPGKPYGINKKEGKVLKQIGIENRRVSILAPFNLLLGYWHSFHLPFAFFMYIVAVVHIVAALLFAVKH